MDFFADKENNVVSKSPLSTKETVRLVKTAKCRRKAARHQPGNDEDETLYVVVELAVPEKEMEV